MRGVSIHNIIIRLNGRMIGYVLVELLMSYSQIIGKTRGCTFFFFFQAEDGIRVFCLSRGASDGYKSQMLVICLQVLWKNRLTKQLNQI